MGAMGLKIQYHKNNMGRYSNYKTMSFDSLTFLGTCALDFICANVFVIRTYRYVNFISMVVGWLEVNMGLGQPLIGHTFPFLTFFKTLIFPSIDSL